MSNGGRVSPERLDRSCGKPLMPELRSKERDLLGDLARIQRGPSTGIIRSPELTDNGVRGAAYAALQNTFVWIGDGGIRTHNPAKGWFCRPRCLPISPRRHTNGRRLWGVCWGLNPLPSVYETGDLARDYRRHNGAVACATGGGPELKKTQCRTNGRDASSRNYIET